MSISEELDRLDQLRQRGVLSDTEFARAKARLLDDQPAAGVAPLLAAMNSLRRSRSERWIAGVCGGLAQATRTDAWIWRLLFSLLFLFGGLGLVIYFLMWLFVPHE